MRSPSAGSRSWFASAALPMKVAVLVTLWCVVSALLISLAYGLKGPAGAANKLYELAFVSVVLAFVGPALALGHRLEPGLRRRFPGGGSFIAIAVTLVPSLALGIGVAVLLMKLVP